MTGVQFPALKSDDSQLPALLSSGLFLASVDTCQAQAYTCIKYNLQKSLAFILKEPYRGYHRAFEMIMILSLFRYIWATSYFLHNLEFNLKCVKRSSFRRFLGSLEILLQYILFGNFLSCNKHQLLWKSHVTYMVFSF